MSRDQRSTYESITNDKDNACLNVGPAHNTIVFIEIQMSGSHYEVDNFGMNAVEIVKVVRFTGMLIMMSMMTMMTEMVTVMMMMVTMVVLKIRWTGFRNSDTKRTVRSKCIFHSEFR